MERFGYVASVPELLIESDFEITQLGALLPQEAMICMYYAVNNA